MATYPDKKFQGIYDSIIASMGDDDALKANIENALRPLYEQSLADLNQRRIERNAAIDVDAASRGMGNSTWVTDAKLRQLKDTEGNIALLDANYNNQLYSALADAIKDRDADAYNKALFWWQQGNKGGSGSGSKGEPEVIFGDEDGDENGSAKPTNNFTPLQPVLNFGSNIGTGKKSFGVGRTGFISGKPNMTGRQ